MDILVLGGQGRDVEKDARSRLSDAKPPSKCPNCQDESTPQAEWHWLKECPKKPRLGKKTGEKGNKKGRAAKLASKVKELETLTKELESRASAAQTPAAPSVPAAPASACACCGARLAARVAAFCAARDTQAVEAVSGRPQWCGQSGCWRR